jgi:hypothetical protein
MSGLPLSTSWWLFLLGVAVLATAGRLLGIWWHERGPRAIVCPENLRAAGVTVDARHAALTGFAGRENLRLSSCSRWPDRAGCGQQCLTQVESSPEGCLVRNILVKWYEGKSCSLCGKPFGEIEWSGQKPALVRADKVSVEWSRVPAEQLTETLETASPVCFACHMANTLVRERPDLAIDRSCRTVLKS